MEHFSRPIYMCTYTGFCIVLFTLSDTRIIVCWEVIPGEKEPLGQSDYHVTVTVFMFTYDVISDPRISLVTCASRNQCTGCLLCVYTVGYTGTLLHWVRINITQNAI